MSYRRQYVILAMTLGFGAPLGALVLRAFFIQHAFWIEWLRQEWTRYGYFYLYMAVGSAIVFSLFGYWAGRRGDRLTVEQEKTEDTFAHLNLLALTDGLTGLYNHRYLQERLALEIESANRHGTTLTACMVDLDNFKKLNDRHGHPFGDLVLVTVARIIRENLRRIDMAGRYGGEEFMIVMAHTTVEEAMPVADRIRTAVEEYPFSLRDEEVHVTLSIGMAIYPSSQPPIHDKSTFIRAMDQALYHAKWKGKNRIIVRTGESTRS